MAVVVVGSYNHDLIFQTDRLPRRGESRFGTLNHAHGGKGFNQAIAANRLGAATLFIGAVGNDSFAQSAREFAEGEALRCSWQRCPEPTGVASVAIEDGGENQIVVAPGANQALSSEHVSGQSTALKTADVVVTQLETELAGPLRAFELSQGLKILNPAPFAPQLVEPLLRRADLVTPNETEFAGLAKVVGIDLPDDWQAHADEQLQRWCRQLSVETVIITLGASGAFVSTPDAAERIAGRAVTAVDTTGAGDAFNGALAAGLVRFDRDLGAAVAFANRAASISVTRPGAAPSMPRLAELTD